MDINITVSVPDDNNENVVRCSEAKKLAKKFESENALFISLCKSKAEILLHKIHVLCTFFFESEDYPENAMPRYIGEIETALLDFSMSFAKLKRMCDALPEDVIEEIGFMEPLFDAEDFAEEFYDDLVDLFNTVSLEEFDSTDEDAEDIKNECIAHFFDKIGGEDEEDEYFDDDDEYDEDEEEYDEDEDINTPVSADEHERSNFINLEDFMGRLMNSVQDMEDVYEDDGEYEDEDENDEEDEYEDENAKSDENDSLFSKVKISITGDQLSEAVLSKLAKDEKFNECMVSLTCLICEAVEDINSEE